jgi:membrane protein
MRTPQGVLPATLAATPATMDSGITPDGRVRVLRASPPSPGAAARAGGRSPPVRPPPGAPGPAAARGSGLVRRFAVRFVTGQTALLASALAYGFFVSLFPFVIMVATISGALVRYLGLPDVVELLFRLLEQLPPAVADPLRTELQQIVSGGVPQLLSITVVGTLWAATFGANILLLAMDRAYGVTAGRRGPWRMLWAGALTLLAGWGLVAGGLLVGLLLIFERALARLLEGTGAPVPPGELVLWAALAALAFLGAAGVYRLAPSVTHPWREVLPGALLFGAGWLVVTVGISIFVTVFADLGVTYGALAGAVALLMWLYWTAYLLLAGAVLNAVLGERQAEPVAAPVQASPDGGGTRDGVR